MTRTRTLLCLIYGAIALMALIATWDQNLAYLGGGTGDPLSDTLRFWGETFSTPASASITLDLFLFGLAATVWMVFEARRLGIRFVWLYVFFGTVIAISFTFPLFLIARERRLHALAQQPPPDGRLGWGDVIGLIGFGLPAVIVSVWSLLH